MLYLVGADALAVDKDNIYTLELDRPIWAVGLKDAAWLLPAKDAGAATFAIFNFSVEMRGVPTEGQTRKEDDAGRISRALPLYFAERINIETRSKAINYNLVMNGVGPVVAGKRTGGKDIASALKAAKPTFIITGHFEKDFLKLRNKLTVYVYDPARNKERVLAEVSELFSDTHRLASKSANSFVEKLCAQKYCTRSVATTNYSAPPDALLLPYLDALGQLFVQTLVQNGIAPKTSLWGEDDMLLWYSRLWHDLPQSDASKLMYFRGVTASIDYKGDAYKNHLMQIEEFLKNSQNKADVLNRLSPLYYQATGNKAMLRLKCSELRAIKDPIYAKWLDQFEVK